MGYHSMAAFEVKPEDAAAFIEKTYGMFTFAGTAVRDGMKRMLYVGEAKAMPYDLTPSDFMFSGPIPAALVFAYGEDHCGVDGSSLVFKASRDRSYVGISADTWLTRSPSLETFLDELQKHTDTYRRSL